MTSSHEFKQPIDNLLSRLLDGALNDGEQDLLAELLQSDSQARQIYHEHIALHAMLHWIDSEPLKQDVAERPRPAALKVHSPVLGFLGNAMHGSVSGVFEGWPMAYVVATVIFAVGLLIGQWITVSNPIHVAQQPAPPIESLQDAKPALVGRITGAADCKWAANSLAAITRDYVAIGRLFQLDAGLLEITYDTGVKVILQGPVTYKIESRSGGFLSIGKLTARVEKKGERSGERGEGAANHQIPNPKSQILVSSPLSPLLSPLFSVRTPTATVVDLGTEFGVEVDKEGATKSHVFVGSVRVEPADGMQDHAVIVRADESVSVERKSDGAGAKFVVHRGVAKPEQFVRTDWAIKRAEEQKRQSFGRRQALAESIRRDPALVAYYDFQRQSESPNVLHAVGPGAKGALDGAIASAAVRGFASLEGSNVNLLSGKPAEVTSTYNNDPNWAALYLTDGTEASHVFSDNDAGQRMVIHGFHSPVRLIRIWKASDRIAQQVTIKSSLSDSTSLNAADYGVALAAISSLTFNADGYVDIRVNAPAGTQSLLFDFGCKTEYGGLGVDGCGARTTEIQAFATIPEPPAFSTPSATDMWSNGRVPGTTALQFNGVDTCVKVNLPQRLTQMTLAAWVTIDFIDDRYPACSLLMSDGWSKRDGSPEKCHWQINRTGEICLAAIGAAENSVKTPSVLPWQQWGRNRWRHLAVVADPAHRRATCYLDGKQVLATEISEKFATTFGSAAIGNWLSDAGRIERGFCGRMDDLVIFSRAMTAQEIKEMYDAGKP